MSNYFKNTHSLPYGSEVSVTLREFRGANGPGSELILRLLGGDTEYRACSIVAADVEFCKALEAWSRAVNLTEQYAVTRLSKTMEVDVEEPLSLLATANKSAPQYTLLNLSFGKVKVVKRGLHVNELGKKIARAFLRSDLESYGRDHKFGKPHSVTRNFSGLRLVDDMRYVEVVAHDRVQIRVRRDQFPSKFGDWLREQRSYVWEVLDSMGLNKTPEKYFGVRGNVVSIPALKT